MYKILALFLFSLPSITLAQTADNTMSSSSAASAPSAPEPAAQRQSMATINNGSVTHRPPVASVAMHYNYMFQTSPYVGNRSLMGWSVVPEVNLTHRIGFQADFTSLYMRGGRG
jgi:hypothetical protein